MKNKTVKMVLAVVVLGVCCVGHFDIWVKLPSICCDDCGRVVGF